jgi:hypothetical protein
MSGYLDDEALRRDVSQGKVRCLQKPFNMGAVAREVHAALSHRR